MRSRTVPLLLLALTVAAILIATLSPGSTDLPPTPLCLLCARGDAADVVANLILFTPFGFFLAWLGWPTRRTIVAAALFSGAIELSQLIFVAGRDASVSDVTMNTLGAVLGFALFRGVCRALRAGPPASMRLAAALAGVAGLTIGAGDWLLQPLLPPTMYWGQWTADMDGDLGWYRGRVLSADVGGIAMSSHRSDQSPAIRQLLQRGAPVRVHGIAGPAPSRLSPLFSIYDQRREEVLLIGPQDSDLVLRYRMRAAEWRFDQPDFRVPGAFRGLRPGDTLDLAMWRVQPGGASCLRLNGVQACGLAPTAGRAWSLLQYPEWFPEWWKHVLDAIWLALLALPAGFCVARAVDLGAPLCILGLALLSGPALLGIGPSPSAEWAAALAGLAAGLLVRWGMLRLGVAGPTKAD